MKNVIIIMTILSSVIFAGGGKSKGKYTHPSRNGKIIKVAYDIHNSNVCKRYVYLHTVVKTKYYQAGGKKGGSDKYDNGKAEMKATSGSRTRDCGQPIKIDKMELAQWYYIDAHTLALVRLQSHRVTYSIRNTSNLSKALDDYKANTYRGSAKYPIGYITTHIFVVKGKSYTVRIELPTQL